jgi:hypothetical protein
MKLKQKIHSFCRAGQKTSGALVGVVVIFMMDKRNNVIILLLSRVINVRLEDVVVSVLRYFVTT